MIDLYFCSTPNGMKPLIFLYEHAVPHRPIHLNTLAAENFSPAFLAISPNGKIPAIVDHAPDGAGEAVAVFESGAILLYLAHKLGQPAAGDPAVLSWLFWQMASLGPMSGQRAHFSAHAPAETGPYALQRFDRELRRLYVVLDHALAGRDFVAGPFSIADMAIYPWVRAHPLLQIDLGEFPAIAAWSARMASRPSVAAAYAFAAEHPMTWPKGVTPEQKALLFAFGPEHMRAAYRGEFQPWPDA